MTSQELVERALHKIASPDADVQQLSRLRAALSVQVKSALEALAKQVAAGADYHNLQKEFNLTAVAGRVDLAGVPANTILFRPYRAQVYIGTSEDPAVYIERPETLKSGGLSLDTVYYSHRGQILTFLNTDNQTDTLAGSVRVVANYVPLINEVPAEYSKTLIDLLAEIQLSGASLQKVTNDAREGANEGRA